MRKKLIGTAVFVTLLLALYAELSWYLGARVQTASQTALESVNIYLAKNWSAQVQIRLREYQRGIFTSQAAYVVSFPPAKNSTVKPEVLVVNRITHDALSFSQLSQGKFEWLSASIHTALEPTAFTEALFKATGGHSLIDGTTRLSSKGVAKLDWVIRPVDHTQETMRWKLAGASLRAEIGPNLSYTKGEFKIDALSMTDGKATVAIQSGRLHTDTQPSQSGLGLGVSGADLDELTVTSLNFPTVVAKKIKTRLVLNEKDHLLNGQSHYEVESVSLDKKNWGALRFTANYDKLNSDAVKSLADLYNDVLSRSLSNASDADLVTTADLKQFWTTIQTLLKTSPTLKIDPFAWQTPEGQSSVTLSTVLAPVELRAGGLGLSGNPIQAIDATIALSRAMVAGLFRDGLEVTGMKTAEAKTTADKEIKVLLDAATKLKLGTLKDDRLVTRLSFKDNALKVNEQSVPAEALLSLVGSIVPTSWLASEPVTTSEGPDETSAVRHLDPSVLASILTGADFTFEEVKDEQGDPLLKVAPGDSGAAKIDIIFVGCGNDPTCEDVLLRATYSPDQPVALQVANDWNLRKRWARAYVNDQREAVIEMDISAYGGIGRDAVEGMVNTFFKIVRDFSKELKEKN